MLVGVQRDKLEQHVPTTTKLAEFFILAFLNSSATLKFFDAVFGASLTLSTATSFVIPLVDFPLLLGLIPVGD